MVSLPDYHFRIPDSMPDYTLQLLRVYSVQHTNELLDHSSIPAGVLSSSLESPGDSFVGKSRYFSRCSVISLISFHKYSPLFNHPLCITFHIIIHSFHVVFHLISGYEKYLVWRTTDERMLGASGACTMRSFIVFRTSPRAEWVENG